MSSINNQTTFQSASEAIKPNRLVQPPAQERPETPAAASKHRSKHRRPYTFPTNLLCCPPAAQAAVWIHGLAEHRTLMLTEPLLC